ncbi:MAG: acyl-CoA dehydrogenase family protein [Chloroflexota bacterium]|nr:acyl-CoA dehydrogenase family protein [Chloroflexota bacterium]
MVGGVGHSSGAASDERGHTPRVNALDFRFSPEQVALRSEVERFIRDCMPEELRWCERDAFSDALWPLVTEARRELARLGWTTIHWPSEHGGRGASRVTHTLIVEAMSYRGVPQVVAFDDGPNIIGPVLMRFGSEQQKRIHLPAIARADVFWCQAYTEPEAGSDMAAMSTTATLNGDHYVLSGRKKFVGGAARADWAHVLARTGPDEHRHHNLGYFLVDMRSPGISLKPIEESHGRYGMLNEVVFDDVRVPTENLLGGHDEGWQVAMSALDLERSGIENVGRAQGLLEDVIEYAQASGRSGGRSLLDDPAVRQRLADASVKVETSRLAAYKVAWLSDQGLPITHQSSMSKLMTSETWQHVAAVALRTLGPDALLLPDADRLPLRGRIALGDVSSLSETIYEGASEIQRNIIAQRGLGLPR